MAITPFKNDKTKFEGRPIVFQSTCCNSILDDNSQGKMLPRHYDDNNGNGNCNGNGHKSNKHSDTIEHEIHRPSNEYVLVRADGLYVSKKNNVTQRNLRQRN